MNKIKIYYKNNKQNPKTIEVEYANTYLKRLIGLMNKTNFNGLLFKQNYSNRFQSSIHSCFMKKTIDIIYINDNNQIQEFTTLRPWHLYIPHHNNTKYIIELPENSIKQYNLELNLKIEII